MKTWGSHMLLTDLVHRLRRCLFVVAMGSLTLLHSPVQAADALDRYDPVANPRAVVTSSSKVSSGAVGPGITANSVMPRNS